MSKNAPLAMDGESIKQRSPVTVAITLADCTDVQHGLLAAAPDAEMQHVRSGDWAIREKAMLAEAGTLIAPITMASAPNSLDISVLFSP